MSESPIKKKDKKFGITLYCPVTVYLKTPHFTYLLLSMFILLLPESLLVICLINWHTGYLPFTANSLIWRVCFHVQKYVWDSKLGIILRWSRTVCHGIFSKSWTGYYIYIYDYNYNYNQYTVTESLCYCVYFYFLYFYWWLWMCYQ